MLYLTRVTNDTQGQIDMSRGLGKLQREILDTLDEDHLADYVTHDRRPIYNLLAVKETLAQVKGRTDRLYVPELQAVYVWHTGAFTSAFSRAIRTLIKRGVLSAHYLPTRNGNVDLYHIHSVSRHELSVKSQRHLCFEREQG